MLTSLPVWNRRRKRQRDRACLANYPDASLCKRTRRIKNKPKLENVAVSREATWEQRRAGALEVINELGKNLATSALPWEAGPARLTAPPKGTEARGLFAEMTASQTHLGGPAPPVPGSEAAHAVTRRAPVYYWKGRGRQSHWPRSELRNN